MSNRYEHMQIIKTPKQEVKLYAFYIIDLGIMIAGFMLISYLNKALNLTMPYYIALQFLTFLFTVFLCAKPKEYGKERNLKIIMRLLKMDGYLYHSQVSKNYLSTRNKGES